MTRLILAVLLATSILAAQARTRTTQTNLRTAAITLDAIPASTVADSALLAAVDQNAVTLRGYNKRAGDAKESFLVTNNTDHRLSAIRITLRYTALDGATLHERDVTVPLTVAPGESQLVAITSFDRQHLFYYYAGPAPRKAATPYRVAFRLNGYDIPVGR